MVRLVRAPLWCLAVLMAPAGAAAQLGAGTIDWHIERSPRFPATGAYSLEYYLANWNAAGKIWIEQGFPVRPLTSYRVAISYRIASS